MPICWRSFVYLNHLEHWRRLRSKFLPQGLKWGLAWAKILLAQWQNIKHNPAGISPDSGALQATRDPRKGSSALCWCCQSINRNSPQLIRKMSSNLVGCISIDENFWSSVDLPYSLDVALDCDEGWKGNNSHSFHYTTTTWVVVLPKRTSSREVVQSSIIPVFKWHEHNLVAFFGSTCWPHHNMTDKMATTSCGRQQ